MNVTEKAKRNFIDDLLDMRFNLRVNHVANEIDQIEIRNDTDALICLINFDDNKPDQILLKSIGWVKPPYLFKLRTLYKEIEKLFMISDDKKAQQK